MKILTTEKTEEITENLVSLLKTSKNLKRELFRSTVSPRPSRVVVR